MTRRALASIVGVAVVALALFGIPLAIAVRSQTQKDELLELGRIATRQSARISPANISRASCRLRIGRARDACRRLRQRRAAASAVLVPIFSIRALRPRWHGDIARQHGAWFAVAVPIVSDARIIGVDALSPKRAAT